MAENEQDPRPPQHQERQPGIESQMTPRPTFEPPAYRAAGKLEGKKALITGGDSGIGRAVAVLFAKEGADVAIGYLDEQEDAEKTRDEVQAEGRRCVLLPGDVADPAFCRQLVEDAVAELGGLDVLVNNAAVQYPQDRLEDVDDEQLERTFRINIFSTIRVTRAALPHLKEGAAIVNTTSITAFRGNATLIDYSATKGAILAFTRSLAANLASKGIRVNAVAPGPIWTPLIPASFDAEKVAKFGEKQPLGRAGQPAEVAPAYVFLASSDASYISGQTIHPNGGESVGG